MLVLHSGHRPSVDASRVMERGKERVTGALPRECDSATKISVWWCIVAMSGGFERKKGLRKGYIGALCSGSQDGCPHSPRAAPQRRDDCRRRMSTVRHNGRSWDWRVWRVWGDCVLSVRNSRVTSPRQHRNTPSASSHTSLRVPVRRHVSSTGTSIKSTGIWKSWRNSTSSCSSTTANRSSHRSGTTRSISTSRLWRRMLPQTKQQRELGRPTAGERPTSTVHWPLNRTGTWWSDRPDRSLPRRRYVRTGEPPRGLMSTKTFVS